MSYKINYLDDKNIVQVEIQGRMSFKIAQQYSTDALKLAHEYNCKKYLINHLQTSLEEGIYKIHTDGDTLEHFGFNSNDKIAIVISRNRMNSHLFESSDYNVKWSNFKYFNDINKAFHWLEKDE